MCGVAFAYSENRIKELVSRLKHRGPDAQRFVYQRSSGIDCYLGHTRLAIVDLQSGVQPKILPHSITAFNGEIFNQKALSNEDEVSLIAELLNTSLLDIRLLSGYFAILHLDISRGRLIAARDPIGVVPLYYCRKTLEFASEPDLLHSPRAVAPGTVVTLDLRTKRLKEQRFHRLEAHVSTTALSMSVAVETLLSATYRVASHSDVGFSLALSGGLDSGLLAYCLREVKLPPHECLTFTCSLNSIELARAKRTADQLGFNHQTILLNDVSFSQAAQHYNKTYNAGANQNNPIKARGFVRQYAIASSSRTKVILCGEGADELDCGYPSHERENKSVSSLARKRLSVFSSQPSMTLDRVNQAGMAYSKEYRVPYLDLGFVDFMLSLPPRVGKKTLREIANHVGLKASEDKYTDDDSHLFNSAVELLQKTKDIL